MTPSLQIGEGGRKEGKKEGRKDGRMEGKRVFIKYVLYFKHTTTFYFSVHLILFHVGNTLFLFCI
jgi:hypothetical protein